MKKTFKTLLILVVAISLGACSLTSNPTQAPTPNIEPTLNAARTEAAATVAAEIESQPTATGLPATATLAPSSTPVSTNTLIPETQVPPTNTPLPQATNTPVPTLSSSSGITNTPSGLACTITEKSGGGTQTAGADFDARWTVKNIGSTKWLTSAVDYKFSSGTKMQKHGDVFDLPSDVASGESIGLIVDMTAPTTAGIYTSVWIITLDGKVVCNLPVQITVK
jgi:hypothetical protein